MESNSASRKLVPLKEAANELGIERLSDIRRDAKRYGCLTVLGSLEFVDTAKLLKVASDKAATNAIPKKKQDSPGKKIGLLRARIKRTPQLLENKQYAIDEAKQRLANAENAYEKRMAEREVKKLQADFDRMTERLRRDKEELNKILNEEPGEE